MKTESGSPSDLAGSLHRDDGERADDPKLRAMRAVWLEMRDEDPPERGLAELLAAARTKAQAMQERPTLWQRLVAGLARPPALALATVMVLVGGAVLIGRRGVDVSAPARTAGMAAPEHAGREPATPVRPEAIPEEAPADLPGDSGEMTGAMKEADEGAAPSEALPKDGLADERARTKAGPAGGWAAPAKAPAKPEPAVRPPASTEASKKAKPADMASADKHRWAEQAPAAPASKDAPGVTAGNGEAERPRVSSAPPSKPAPRPAPNADSAGAQSPPPAPPAHEPAGASDDITTTASVGRDEPSASADVGESAKKVAPAATAKHDTDAKASLDPLYKQCESAAQRGDCATVRSLVGRITKSDPGYRARLAKGSPVVKCLAE